MGCMKCGRETASRQVFCEKCLDEMEKYPVKPGTVVRLPQRREESVFKKSLPRRRVQITLEEQVKSMKKTLRSLIATVILLMVLLCVAGYFAVAHLLETQTVFLPGQNYSSMTTPETTEGE